MNINRREFIKYCAFITAAMGIGPGGFTRVVHALEKAIAKPPLLWFNALDCGGCFNSVANSGAPSLGELILDMISLQYFPEIQSLDGDKVTDQWTKSAADGRYILAVSGAVPLGDLADFCIVGTLDDESLTAQDAILKASKKASAVMAVGTCAAYGGITGDNKKVSGGYSLGELVREKPIIKVPGCPPHPDWMIQTIVHFLLYGLSPKMDKDGLPLDYYGKSIHDNCPRRSYFERGQFQQSFEDEPGCLLNLGCKGPVTQGDCFERQWNGGQSWCVESGAPCIGCTNKNFYDRLSPVTERLPDLEMPGLGSMKTESVGKALGFSVGMAVAGHAAYKGSKWAQKKWEERGNIED